MDPKQIEERNAPFLERKRAILNGYEHKFNKKSLRAGEGKGNVVPCEGENVEGALYTITQEGLHSLDTYEKGYERKEIEVDLGDGSKVKAWAYMAKSDMVKEGLKPTKHYRDQYLKGDDLLSPGYREKLRKEETLD